MKKIVFAVLFTTLFALPLHAQRFEWAKSYTGPGYNVSEIIGSFTDAEGNLYFLGKFTGGAGFNGVSFVPPTLITTKNCTVLGKLSPAGELLWYKTLASTYSHCTPIGLAKASDTTLMIASTLNLPFYVSSINTGHNSVYYFDTLLTEDDGYLMPTDSIFNIRVTTFATFNLEGNLVEKHFLQMAYEDTSGHVFREQNVNESFERIQTNNFSMLRFTIDSEGNIIMGRSAAEQITVLCDTCEYGYNVYSVENGGIGALRIVVDGNLRHTWHPTHRSHRQNVLLFKFSPGFDSLLDATYVLDSTDAYAETLDTTIAILGQLNSIGTDSEGNIYIDLLHGFFPSIPIANSESRRISSEAMSSCLKYNPQLHLVNLYEMESEDYTLVRSHITPEGELYLFYNPFYIGYTPGYNPFHPAVYRGDTLDLNDLAFWLRLDAADGRLLAYGKVPSTVKSFFNGLHPSYAVINNRVFAQVKYWQSIEAPDTTINLGVPDYGLGLMQWDTDGHVIGFIDFDAHAPDDYGGQIHVIDSVVYMTGGVFAGATFGTTQVEPSEDGAAYIAKYVDTSLMHPYVYSDPRQPQYIEWEQDLTFPLSDTLIELTATATSGLPVGYSCDDTTVARVSDGVLRLLRVGTATVTATQNGSTYGYYPAAPVTRLLTIHQEGIEGVEPAAFSVYPNPTHGDVYLCTADEPLVSVSLYTADGRQLPVRMQGNSVSLAPYPAGVYYLQVTTPTNTYRHKVTKQ